jgi:hypothetical protein
MKNLQKGFVAPALIAVIALLVLGGGVYFFTNERVEKEVRPEIFPPVATSTKPAEPVACTMDAKLCPDGSYVGRSGSKCEFVCPTAN